MEQTNIQNSDCETSKKLKEENKKLREQIKELQKQIENYKIFIQGEKHEPFKQ